jgi:hypothetical protein
MANLTATMNEVFAIITDNTSGLMDLEDKVAGQSTEVSSLKADQDRLHVAINIQGDVSPTMPLLPDISWPPASSRSTLTAPPTIEELRIRIATLFALREEHHVEAPGTTIVVSSETFFEDALREEAR